VTTRGAFITGKPKGAVVENGSFATMAVPYAEKVGLHSNSRVWLGCSLVTAEAKWSLRSDSDKTHTQAPTNNVPR
jgi:hypothetical protein